MREFSSKLNKLSFLSECDILAIDVLKKKISSFDVEIQKKDYDIREQLNTLTTNEKKHSELQTEIDQYKKHKSMDTDNLKKHEEDLNKLQTIIKRAQNKIVDLKQEVNLSESNKIDTIKRYNSIVENYNKKFTDNENIYKNQVIEKDNFEKELIQIDLDLTT